VNQLGGQIGSETVFDSTVAVDDIQPIPAMSAAFPGMNLRFAQDAAHAWRAVR